MYYKLLDKYITLQTELEEFLAQLDEELQESPSISNIKELCDEFTKTYEAMS